MRLAVKTQNYFFVVLNLLQNLTQMVGRYQTKDIFFFQASPVWRFAVLSYVVTNLKEYTIIGLTVGYKRDILIAYTVLILSWHTFEVS